MPSFSIIIPTAGRQELRNCLNSIVFQLEAEDEVLVVGDDLDSALEETQAIVTSFGNQFVYLPYAGNQHTFGHDQINYGIRKATGQWLSFIDDDDVYVPDAFRYMRQIVSNQNSPVLFRFLSYMGFLCWLRKGVFLEGYIGGHCIVCPNIPEKLGQWSAEYAGDWSFVRDTVNFYGGHEQILWDDKVIAIARPSTDVLHEIEGFVRQTHV